MAIANLNVWLKHRHASEATSPPVENAYLSLPLLPLAGHGHRAGLKLSDAEWLWDRAFSNLAIDLVRFELGALDPKPFPTLQMRPDATLVSERCLLALEAAAPALCRRGLEGSLSEGSGLQTLETVRRLCSEVEATLSADERRILARSVQPFTHYHDEYLFVRSLQALETTFSFVSFALHRVREALLASDAESAVASLRSATRTLLEAEPLFALLGTMRVDPFLDLRKYTAAVHAVQARGYETLGGLCRSPGAGPLDALNPRLVVEAKEHIVLGQATLSETFAFACHTDKLDGADREKVEAAMTGLEMAVLQWRKAHRRLASRMLGRQMPSVSSPVLQ